MALLIESITSWSDDDLENRRVELEQFACACASQGAEVPEGMREEYLAILMEQKQRHQLRAQA